MLLYSANQGVDCMKKIVFGEELNIRKIENLDYEPEVEKTILERATKYYSYNRLNFNDEDEYKIFTVKIDGKKYRLVVSVKKPSELSKETWKEIFQKTHKNVILFHTVEYELKFEDEFDTEPTKRYFGPYIDILKSKAFYTPRRNTITYWLNKLLWIFACISAFVLLPSAVLGYAMIKAFTFIIVLIKAIGSIIAIDHPDFAAQDGPMVTWLIRLIDYPAYLIANIINNAIGDIKNNTFVEGAKNALKETIEKTNNVISQVFNAIKNKIEGIRETRKEKRNQKRKAEDKLNNSLSEIAKSMDENEIKPKVYKLNTENLIGTVVEFNDAYVEHSKKQIKIATKQLKDPSLSLYYARRLNEVCDHYKKNKNTESDIVKSVIISELKSLKDDLEKYIIISNNQTEIDTYLEELKEEANQYRKARQ